MKKVININDKYFEKEIKRILKNNNGNGYTRIAGIINSLRLLGKTKEEILNQLRKIN
ncbi:hypothetical protein ACFHWD_03725 [Clostridium sp. MT-14]|uniref:hypothetical protein n=1 Tax=Clostridium sp. MT-14 TaxID=3348360 RepID=UPI0035F30224